MTNIEYGRELQEKIAKYPERLIKAHEQTKRLDEMSFSANERDNDFYRQLKDFKNRKLANQEVLVRMALGVYKKLRLEAAEDDSKLFLLIEDAPEDISQDRRNSLLLSQNQLQQVITEMEVQIRLFESHLHTIVESKGAINEAMRQQKVATLLPIMKELTHQVRAIKRGKR
ncbi:MAG: hypothetical protein K6F57_05385 [Candidatus Saccharibacteria bacterium]|nr:hypothetical protein [Candidatus Saccharibacteria bacterium]